MRKKILLSLIAFFVFISGCSSYHATRQAPLITNPIAQQNKKIQDDVELMIFPITTFALQKQIFDTDMVSKGILPVQLSIVNKRESNIIFSRDAVTLITPDNDIILPTSNYDIATETDKSYARSVG